MNKNTTLIILIILFSVLSLLITIGKAKAEAPEPSPEEIYSTAMDQWLDRLMWDESNNKKMLVILDTNNKYSYGCLQFQAATWAYQAKKYGVTKEIMDCDAQRYVARKMIDDDWNAWVHWKTSVTKKTAGYPPKQ